MSVLTLKSFSVNQIIGSSTYVNTLIIPVNLDSGNEVTIVTNLVELYAMCNSFSNPNEFKLVQDILKLGYRCILFRVLDINDYSAIKLVGDKNYYYYNPNKTYLKSDIRFPQMGEYLSCGLINSTVYDFSTVSESNINDLLFFYDYTSGLTQDNFVKYVAKKLGKSETDAIKLAYKFIPYIEINFNNKIYLFYFSRTNYDDLFIQSEDRIRQKDEKYVQVCTKFDKYTGNKGTDLRNKFEVATQSDNKLQYQFGIEDPFDNGKYHYLDEDSEIKDIDREELQESAEDDGGSPARTIEDSESNFEYIDNMDNASSFKEIVKAFADTVVNSELPFLCELLDEYGYKVRFISNRLRPDTFVTNINTDESGNPYAPQLSDITYYVDYNRDYELMHSYYIEVPGLQIRSKVPSCIKDIKLKIHYSTVTDLVFEISRIDSNGDNLYNETFVVTNVKGSVNEDNPDYSLKEILNKSNLIVVDSCDIDVFEVDISGEYLLGNLSYQGGNAGLIDYANKLRTIEYELDDFTDIVGIIDTHIYINKTTWLEYHPDLNFDNYVSAVSNYYTAMSDFARELDCIVFTSDPPKLENSLIDVQRLAVFQPNILNTEERRIVPSYLIMLDKLTTGNYNGNTNQVYLLDPNTVLATEFDRNQHKNVCITEYVDYQYIVGNCYIRYNNLFVNMQFVVLNVFIYKYILGYLTYKGIAYNDISDTDLISKVMSTYGDGALYSMTIDKKTKVDRKLTLEITLTYREVVYYSFKLFVNLQVNY